MSIVAALNFLCHQQHLLIGWTMQGEYAERLMQKVGVTVRITRRGKNDEWRIDYLK
jgi:hypothetical protein